MPIAPSLCRSDFHPCRGCSCLLHRPAHNFHLLSSLGLAHEHLGAQMGEVALEQPTCLDGDSWGSGQRAHCTYKPWRDLWDQYSESNPASGPNQRQRHSLRAQDGLGSRLAQPQGALEKCCLPGQKQSTVPPVPPVDTSVLPEAWGHVSSDSPTAQQRPEPHYLPGSCCWEPSTGCAGAEREEEGAHEGLSSDPARVPHPPAGRRQRECAGQRKEKGAARALPRASRASCVEASHHRALFTPAGQTKASLSSAGVGHQRAGRRGRAGEGGQAGRKDGERRDGARRDGAGNKQRAWTHTRRPPEQTQGLLGAKHLTHRGCHQSPLRGLRGLPARGSPAQPRVRSGEGPSGARLCTHSRWSTHSPGSEAAT